MYLSIFCDTLILSKFSWTLKLNNKIIQFNTRWTDRSEKTFKSHAILGLLHMKFLVNTRQFWRDKEFITAVFHKDEGRSQCTCEINMINGFVDLLLFSCCCQAGDQTWPCLIYLLSVGLYCYKYLKRISPFRITFHRPWYFVLPLKSDTNWIYFIALNSFRNGVLL